ncbi:MAG: peptidase C1 [Candidatus Zixiibacteriota bacterium]
MSRMLVCMTMVMMFAGGVAAQTDTIRYVPEYRDPANEELRKLHEVRDEVRDSLTDLVKDRQEALKDFERDNEKWIKCDLSNIVRPQSPEAFESYFHFPPVRQYWTGTCWSFSGTSFLETEVYRINGIKVKLSEMYTVYWEWVEKARRFVAERGKSSTSPGSETNGVFRTMKTYGAVPVEVYRGYIDDPRHDHEELDRQIREYLGFVKEKGLWDESLVVNSVKQILNRHLGEPPVSFEYEGATYTPKGFLDGVLKINPDDYVAIMSTLQIPFYTRGSFDVPDNWWYDSSYYNIPLDEWYAALKGAIRKGYTTAIGGDISEAGLNGEDDVAVVPDFDIPQEFINQHSREYRMYNETTTDDHGIHIVGYANFDGRDWYLVKESSSRGYWGKFDGYMFYRDDYVRLKMMEFAVHKDAVPEILEKFTAAR